MFTGIVEETGEVLATTTESGGRRLRLGTSFADLETGQSISVSGVCLTVEDGGAREHDHWVSVFLSAETCERTYLDELTTNDQVNLERAMPADGRFDGHLVQGHVDGVGTVTGIESIGDDWQFEFSIPSDLERYLVEKGSITVDGISLTVADGGAEYVSAAIIPETYRVTTLSEKAVGDSVHLEVDVLAKYVERLCEADA